MHICQYGAQSTLNTCIIGTKKASDFNTNKNNTHKNKYVHNFCLFLSYEPVSYYIKNKIHHVAQVATKKVLKLCLCVQKDLRKNSEREQSTTSSNSNVIYLLIFFSN